MTSITPPWEKEKKKKLTKNYFLKNVFKNDDHIFMGQKDHKQLLGNEKKKQKKNRKIK
jgi:hypothetical protein